MEVFKRLFLIKLGAVLLIVVLLYTLAGDTDLNISTDFSRDDDANWQSVSRSAGIHAFVTDDNTSWIPNDGPSPPTASTPLPETTGAKSNMKDDGASGGLRQRLPKCLIIGFPKCGTYALKGFLSLHPDIVCEQNSISFFTKNFDKVIEWYRTRMPLSTKTQITIEKTPNYIISLEALRRIQAFNASIKLIIIIRDPVTRIQSVYAQNQDLVKGFNVNIEEFVTDQDKRYSVEINYQKYIRQVYLLFPADQILVLNEERLEGDPLSLLKEVETFLGLRPAFSDDLLVFNDDKGFYCFNTTSPWFSKVIKHSKVNKATGCYLSSKGRPHTDISRKLQKQLMQRIQPLNEKLFSLINKRFNWTDLNDF